MKRTQLYLDEEMSRVLAAESRRRGTTISELVRQAVAATYGAHRATGRTEIIRRLAGVWADRDDLGETESFVRSLRTSERPQRWQRGSRGKVSARQRRHH